MDAVKIPLHVIDQLFQADASGFENSLGNEKAAFQELFSTEGVRGKIPTIYPNNVDQFPNNSLVRFMGMVRDMTDPEFYLGAWKDSAGAWHTSKYRDHWDNDLSDNQETKIWDRRAFVCVEVPSQSGWYTASSATVPEVQHLFNASENQMLSGKESAKRARADDESEKMDIDEEPDQCDMKLSNGPPSSCKSKCVKLEMTATSSEKIAPAANVDVRSCVIIVYDPDLKLQLHDVVEVYGVLSIVPEFAAVRTHQDILDEEGHCMAECDHATAIVPTSQAARIHAISINKVTAAPGIKPARGWDADQRASLLQFFSSTLRDSLAAEYLVMQLPACQPYVRSPKSEDKVTPVLNFVLPTRSSAELPRDHSDSFSSRLASALCTLLPLVKVLPLTVDTLNTHRWCPLKDHDAGRLLPGQLELAPGTVLLLDETQLIPGKLNEKGLANLQDLTMLLRDQTLMYDYEFYKQPIPMSINIIVVSNGPSLLKDSSVLLPLPVRETGLDNSIAAVSSLSPEDLSAARAFLSSPSQLPYSMSDAVHSQLAQDFVETRKQDKEYTAEKFQMQLQLARHLVASLGESELSADCWRSLKELERRREERARVV